MEDDQPLTTLQGEMSSLYALADVLNTLYEQHLTILLVERVEN